MIWVAIAMAIGVWIGYYLPVTLPVSVAKYASVSFLAGLDSVLGGTRAGLEKRFNLSVFVSGFTTNLVLAGLLTWVGDLLGVEMYLAAVVTFGRRIFENLALIRRDLIGVPPVYPATLSGQPQVPLRQLDTADV
jgi:small basic protein